MPGRFFATLRMTTTVIILLLAHVVQAAVSITASITPPNPTLEDEVLLTVTVRGLQKSTEPVLPSLPAFKIVQSGSSTAIQIVNGQTDFKREFTYVMIPVAEGDFTLGPISVFSDGVEYKTDPLSVTVGRGAVRAAPRPQGIPSGPFDPVPQAPADPEEGKPYWITVEVSNLNPYVGEGILYTFRFVTKLNVGEANLTLPDFKDFWTEEVVPEKKYYSDIGGERHVVSEKVIALFPLQTGEMTIGTTLLEVQVPDADPDGFFDPFGFNRRRLKVKRLTQPAISLQVKALPPPPEDFSNLVGEFSMTSKLSDGEIKAGDSATLEIDISGKGNIKEAILPPLPDIPGVKIYDDKPAVETSRTEEGILGKKSFKRALVPTRAMDILLPPFSVSYFDPSEGIYKKMEGASLALKVLPSPDSEPALIPASSRGVSKGDGDIAPLHLGNPYRPEESGMSLFILIGTVPAAAFFAIWGMRRRKNWETLNSGANKSRRALKEFRADLKKIEKGNDDFATPMLAAVKTYVGDRLGTYGQALTVSDLCWKLKERFVPEADELRDILTRLEAACYGRPQGNSSRLEWANQLIRLISKVDKTC